METEIKQYDAINAGQSIVVTENDIYNISALPDKICWNDEEFDTTHAYLSGDYFYLYRGERPIGTPNLRPGIYRDSVTKSIYIMEPTTEEEMREYDSSEHVKSLDAADIIELVNMREEILTAVPGSTKVFMPTIEMKDDILKRLCKQTLIEKNVDLDKVKDRFADKNALFNFKQVIKGDNKVSILIFDRGMDALGLQYQIIITEKDPTNCIGEPLKAPIISSSEDTYDM